MTEADLQRERWRESSRAYRKRNAERVLELGRKWEEKNKEKRNARRREVYKFHGGREKALAWQKKNRKKRNEYLRRWIGMPEPSRPEPALCECCSRPTNTALALDHCHTTGKFRGWLCRKCNTALGLLGDNLKGANNAVEYLRRAIGKEDIE